MKNKKQPLPSYQRPGLITLAISILALTGILLCAAFPAGSQQARLKSGVEKSKKW